MAPPARCLLMRHCLSLRNQTTTGSPSQQGEVYQNLYPELYHCKKYYFPTHILLMIFVVFNAGLLYQIALHCTGVCSGTNPLEVIHLIDPLAWRDPLKTLGVHICKNLNKWQFISVSLVPLSEPCLLISGNKIIIQLPDTIKCGPASVILYDLVSRSIFHTPSDQMSDIWGWGYEEPHRPLNTVFRYCPIRHSATESVDSCRGASKAGSNGAYHPAPLSLTAGGPTLPGGGSILACELGSPTRCLLDLQLQVLLDG